jgi:hypothetical protein
VRAVACALLLSTLVAGGPAFAAGEEQPDAQLLLDLDLLIQAEPRERDLVRRMGLVERLRMLELFRLLESPPASPAARRANPEEGSR